MPASTTSRPRGRAVTATHALALLAASWAVMALVSGAAAQGGVPAYQLDASWPKPLPNNWVLGAVSSVAVDSHDHAWILHRPLTVAPAALEGGKKSPAPPVIEFDEEGNVVQAWGGSGPGRVWMEPSSEPFPRGGAAEHGLHVDGQDNVWVTGTGHVVLKFSKAGKLLLQIGELWRTGGNTSTVLLGNPTDAAVDLARREVYVTDGYINHRVIVFDSETGTYKRHWGAYGRKPDDRPVPVYDPAAPLPDSFFAVHGVGLSRDGFVYVCDRQRNRLQVFRRDGTFVRELVIARDTPAGVGLGGMGGGSVYRVGFSADSGQRLLFVGDSSNSKVWILDRAALEVIGSFEARGIHHLAGADSRGRIYTTGRTGPERFGPK